MNPLEYSPRLVKSFDALELRGRTFKVYGLFAPPHRTSIFPGHDALKEVLMPTFSPPAEEVDHGLGFLILHFAADGTYLLVSQWLDANMIQHRVYRCETGERRIVGIASMAESGVIACVWELEIMKFERDAWVRTVLSHGELDRFSTDAYLAMTFSGWA